MTIDRFPVKFVRQFARAHEMNSLGPTVALQSSAK